jgi:hypothetical protein
MPTGLGMVVHACNPSYEEGSGRRITVQGKPGKITGGPIWKITGAESTKVVAQVVKHLASKHKALNSNPSNTKNNNKMVPNAYIIFLN